MIEILKIIITILGTAMVGSGNQSAQMVAFDGNAESPYFVGKTLPGGVDTQIADSSGYRLSARYMLEGTDYTGQPCRIFIENNGAGGAPFTHPRIVTDSKALSFLNTDSLVGSIEGGTDSPLTIRIHRPMTSVPRRVFAPAQRQGTVETFYYSAKADGKKIKKRAMVYLPHGYDPKDKQTRYPVVYLMHGGGDNSTSFYYDKRSPLSLVNVLDHLIADGKMSPMIVVCPTFYRDDEHIGQNRMENAIVATRDFHQELRQSLIPALDKAYRTLPDRQHRAFGGFSMGALCTWYQLAYDVDAVSRFLPLSGDLWVYRETPAQGMGEKVSAQEAAKWLNDKLQTSPYAQDFLVFAYTGTDDIAGQPETNLVQALQALPNTLFTPRNLQFGVKPGGKHYYGDINEYLYHTLPLLWGVSGDKR